MGHHGAKNPCSTHFLLNLQEKWNDTSKWINGLELDPTGSQDSPGRQGEIKQYPSEGG